MRNCQRKLEVSTTDCLSTQKNQKIASRRGQNLKTDALTS